MVFTGFNYLWDTDSFFRYKDMYSSNLATRGQWLTFISHNGF
jgi:hypothetical protein